MVRCGKTIIRWPSPNRIEKIRSTKYNLLHRLWKKHSVSFFSGFFLFFILILLESGLPENSDQLFFGLFLSFTIGVFFVIIYGLAGMISPRIYIKENCIKYSYLQNVEHKNYSDILCFDIASVNFENTIFRLVVFEYINKQQEFIEIADNISDSAIECALVGRLKRSKISFDSLSIF
jgi:hypothetical protein